MTDIFTVIISKRAQFDLSKVPKHILIKLLAWVSDVEENGLMATRKIPGYHDEPLHGIRFGQRSVRLSKAYRAIYLIKNDKVIDFINIQELSKHDY